ncbi:MAG: PAS domain S-box protein [Candidatus Heimdallarchaeota archaeon]
MANIVDNLLNAKDAIRNLFNSIPNPSYIFKRINNDFELIDFNKAAEKATNGNIISMLNKKASELIDGKPELIEFLNKTLREEPIESKEISYRMKSTGEVLILSIWSHFVKPDLLIIHTEDITNQKLAEENLKKSEQKYRHLFEQSPYSIGLLKIDGTILDLNYTTEKLFGYKKEEIIGKNYLDLTVYPSEMHKMLKKRLDNLLDGKKLLPVEFQIYKKDGNKVWIRSRMSIIKFGDETLIQAFISDITEQKRVEKIVMKKLEIESLISTISSKFVGNVDIDQTISFSLKEMGKLIAANRAYILLYNEDKSLEFFTQEWCVEGIQPQYIDPIIINVDKFPWCIKQYEEKGFIFIDNVSKLDNEAKNTKKLLEDLNIFSLLVFPLTIKKQNSGFIGFDNFNKIKRWTKEDFFLFKTSSEIIGNALERKWSDETLRGSEQLLAGIISSLTEMICLIDKEKNIIWVNNSTKNLFGLDIINKKCFEVFFERIKPCKYCIAEKTFNNGKIHEFETELISDKNKKLKCWCTSSSAALNLEGQTELAVLIFREIN